MNNIPIVWNYFQSYGIKNFILNQLSENHEFLVLFFIVFDEDLWDILITQTNLYVRQIMNDERRRKVILGFPLSMMKRKPTMLSLF